MTDGALRMGPPHEQLPQADRQEIDALLRAAYLPENRTDLEQNVLVADTGERTVLCDSGSGIDRTLGIGTFGAGVGRAIPNMRLAGLPPEVIDVVALTHAHPDHHLMARRCDGGRICPEAIVAVSGINFAYWTALSILDTEGVDPFTTLDVESGLLKSRRSTFCDVARVCGGTHRGSSIHGRLDHP